MLRPFLPRTDLSASHPPSLDAITGLFRPGIVRGYLNYTSNSADLIKAKLAVLEVVPLNIPDLGREKE